MSDDRHTRQLLSVKRLVVVLSGILIAGAVYAQHAQPITPATPGSIAEQLPAAPVTPSTFHNPAPPQPTLPAYGDDRRPRHAELIDMLALTPEQTQRIQPIALKAHRNAWDINQQRHAVRVQLNNELRKPQLDRNAITRLQEQYSQFAQQSAMHRIDAQVASLEVLTPEQRTQLAQMSAQWNEQNSLVMGSAPKLGPANHGLYDESQRHQPSPRHWESQWYYGSTEPATGAPRPAHSSSNSYDVYEMLIPMLGK